MQRDCRNPNRNQYRFVYNGNYNEQVRTYDITTKHVNKYKIKITVSEDVDLSNITFSLANPDVYKPWRPRTSITHVSAREIELLERTLVDVGFFDKPPPSSNLSSFDFYWLVSACIKGKFFQNAYVWPSNSFKHAQFPKLLAMWDFTRIPLNRPTAKSDEGIYRGHKAFKHRNHFHLKFGRNGLLKKYILN